MRNDPPLRAQDKPYADALAHAAAAKIACDVEAADAYRRAATLLLKQGLGAGVDPAAVEILLPVQVVGLQRTGTNLAVYLLKNNFKAICIDIFWKHGLVGNAAHKWNGLPVRYVLCVKNPYAQLVSCYRYFQRCVGQDPTMPQQFHAALSFADFLRTPCYGYRNPIERWNHMYSHWLDVLPPQSMCIVRQEDQITHQGWVVDCIGRNLKLERLTSILQLTQQAVFVGGALHGPLDREYYLRHEYLSSYDSSLMQHVNNEIDPQMLRRFGYEQRDLDNPPIGQVSIHD
jgi:hypothetical protein